MTNMDENTPECCLGLGMPSVWETKPDIIYLPLFQHTIKHLFHFPFKSIKLLLSVASIGKLFSKAAKLFTTKITCSFGVCVL